MSTEDFHSSRETLVLDVEQGSGGRGGAGNNSGGEGVQREDSIKRKIATHWKRLVFGELPDDSKHKKRAIGQLTLGKDRRRSSAACPTKVTADFVENSKVAKLFIEVERKKYMYMLASRYYEMRHFLFEFIPVTCITLVATVLALLDGQPVGKDFPLAIGITSAISVFLQGLAKQLNFGAQAKLQQAAAISLKMLAETMAFDMVTDDKISEAKVKQYRDRFTEANSDVGMIPIRIDDAFARVQSLMTREIQKIRDGLQAREEISGKEVPVELTAQREMKIMRGAFRFLFDQFCCDRKAWPVFLCGDKKFTSGTVDDEFVSGALEAARKEPTLSLYREYAGIAASARMVEQSITPQDSTSAHEDELGGEDIDEGAPAVKAQNMSKDDSDDDGDEEEEPKQAEKEEAEGEDEEEEHEQKEGQEKKKKKSEEEEKRDEQYELERKARLLAIEVERCRYAYRLGGRYYEVRFFVFSFLPVLIFTLAVTILAFFDGHKFLFAVGVISASSSSLQSIAAENSFNTQSKLQLNAANSLEKLMETITYDLMGITKFTKEKIHGYREEFAQALSDVGLVPILIENSFGLLEQKMKNAINAYRLWTEQATDVQLSRPETAKEVQAMSMAFRLLYKVYSTHSRYWPLIISGTNSEKKKKEETWVDIIVAHVMEDVFGVKFEVSQHGFRLEIPVEPGSSISAQSVHV